MARRKMFTLTVEEDERGAIQVRVQNPLVGHEWDAPYYSLCFWSPLGGEMTIASHERKADAKRELARNQEGK